MIVEDEDIIRKGLVEDTPWASFGFEVIGQAANGLQALDILAMQPVDVLLTDIKMPGMNGIDLMQQVHSRYPTVRIVVLSGFSDFSYAQKAIEYGAAAYLLKPTTERGIAELFTKLHRTLDLARENALPESLRQPAADSDNQLTELRDKVLEDLITGRFTEEDKGRIESTLFRAGIHTQDRVALLKVRLDFPDPRQIPPDLLKDVRSSLKQMPDEVSAPVDALAAIDIDPDTTYTILLRIKAGGNASRSVLTRRMAGIRENDACREFADRYLVFLRDQLTSDKVRNVKICMGISTGQDTVYRLRRAYYEADIALGYRFFLGDSQNAYIQVYSASQTTAEIRDSEKDIFDALAAAVANRQRSGMELAIDRFFAHLRQTGNPDPDFLHLKMLELLIGVAAQFRRDAQGWHDLFNDRFAVELRQSLLVANADQVREKMLNMLDQLAEHSAAEASGRSGTIDQVKAYIAANCHRRLPLEEVAGTAFMNPTYFSTYFSQKTGQTYVEYVTAVRMERAKALLRDPEIRVYEVASQVGYSDFRHFSRIFRRATGVNPLQYRQNMLNQSGPGRQP